MNDPFRDAVRVLLSELPVCSRCGVPATFMGDHGDGPSDYLCDLHQVMSPGHDLAWAQTAARLRAMLKV